MPRPPVKGQFVVPNTVAVWVRWSFAGLEFSQLLHAAYSTAGPLNPNMGTTVFTAIANALTTSPLLPLLSPETTLDAVWVKDLRTLNNPWLVSAGGAVAGTGTNPPLPLNVAAVITLVTGLSGKGKEGRSYYAGFDAATSGSDGRIATPLKNALASFADSVRTILGANGMAGQVIMLRPLAADPLATTPPLNQARPAGSQPVLSVAMKDTRWDTQRKRLRH